MEWIKTTLILLLGWLVMITGLIEVLYIWFMIWLAVCIICEAIKNLVNHQVIK